MIKNQVAILDKIGETAWGKRATPLEPDRFWGMYGNT